MCLNLKLLFSHIELSLRFAGVKVSGSNTHAKDRLALLVVNFAHAGVFLRKVLNYSKVADKNQNYLIRSIKMFLL
jgi:hypothetical protein